MSATFRRKPVIAKERIPTNDDDTDIELESTYNYNNDQIPYTETMLQEYEFQHELIGKYIKLKDVKNNNDCVTFQIQSISSPVKLRKDTKFLNSAQQKTIPDLVAESTNQFLLLHRYCCKNGEPTERTNFIVAFTVILLQVLSYIIMSYYLIITRYNNEADRRENCYGPKCDDSVVKSCMDIKTGLVAAILLIGYVWADFINAANILSDSFKGMKIIHHSQFFGAIIILVEAIIAAGCGILVAIYSDDDFDAINGAVGILCVHDLDEKIYSAVSVIESNWKRLFAIFSWILVSVIIATGGACVYNEYYMFGGSMGACKDGEFKCDTGRCIWDGFVCNGVRNCRNGIDERQHCNFSDINCPSDMFRCQSNGACIDIDKVCNGILDCKDGSDEGRENDCSNKLVDCGSTPTFVQKYKNNSWYMDITDGYFKCSSGQCIDGKYLCDGVFDCIDKSDEYPLFNSIQKWPYLRQCPYAKLIECSSDQVLCKVNGKCIGKLRVCDGINDCPDGQDEKKCPWIWGDPWCELLDHYQCGSQIAKINKTDKTIVLFEGKEIIHYEHLTEILDYAGGDGKCLPMEYRCDGMTDCELGDDEKLCELFECPHGEYGCQNGHCIPDDWQCSHIPFCEHDQYAGEGGTFFSNCDWQTNPSYMTCNELVADVITENGGYWSEYIINIPCPAKTVTFTTCNNHTLDYNTIIEGWDDTYEFTFVSDDAGWLCEINYSASTVTLHATDQVGICNRTYTVYVGGKYQQQTSGSYGFQVICDF
eukprot:48872_1